MILLTYFFLTNQNEIYCSKEMRFIPHKVC